ncbi:MAG: AbrB/MazE/SpoVT family DNA-binding domain-containing protein [Haloarculaceae archaeon]
MTDEDDGLLWPPAMFRSFQDASEKAMDQQQELFQQMLRAGTSGLDMNQLGAMSQTATFKTRVQSGGRISIPDAEREALDIEEGDIVQTVVIPVKRTDREDES